MALPCTIATEFSLLQKQSASCCILEPFYPISETSLSWAPWFHKPLIPHKAQASSLFPKITLFYFSNYLILCCKKPPKNQQKMNLKFLTRSQSWLFQTLCQTSNCWNYLACKNTKFLWGPKNAISTPHTYIHQSGLLVGTKSRCCGHHKIHENRWLCWWLFPSKRL